MQSGPSSHANAGRGYRAQSASEKCSSEAEFRQTFTWNNGAEGGCTNVAAIWPSIDIFVRGILRYTLE